MPYIMLCYKYYADVSNNQFNSVVENQTDILVGWPSCILVYFVPINNNLHLHNKLSKYQKQCTYFFRSLTVSWTLDGWQTITVFDVLG